MPDETPKLTKPGLTGGVRRIGKKAAFSWIEVLVVIAILWTIAVIAIPNLPVLIEANRMAKSQKAAISLASLAQAARNSGHPGWSNRDVAVRGLQNGVAVTNPADTNIVIRFQARFLTADERSAAAEYLTSDGTNLIYVPGGSQPTNL